MRKVCHNSLCSGGEMAFPALHMSLICRKPCTRFGSIFSFIPTPKCKELVTGLLEAQRPVSDRAGGLKKKLVERPAEPL